MFFLIFSLKKDYYERNVMNIIHMLLIALLVSFNVVSADNNPSQQNDSAQETAASVDVEQQAEQGTQEDVDKEMESFFKMLDEMEQKESGQQDDVDQK